jgi:hypothetical protein
MSAHFKAGAGLKPSVVFLPIQLRKPWGIFFSRMRISTTILHWLPALFYAGLIFAFSATTDTEIARSYDHFQIMIRGVSPSTTTAMDFSNPKIDLAQDRPWYRLFLPGGFYSLCLTRPGDLVAWHCLDPLLVLFHHRRDPPDFYSLPKCFIKVYIP